MFSLSFVPAPYSCPFLFAFHYIARVCFISSPGPHCIFYSLCLSLIINIYFFPFLLRWIFLWLDFISSFYKVFFFSDRCVFFFSFALCENFFSISIMLNFFVHFSFCRHSPIFFSLFCFASSATFSLLGSFSLLYFVFILPFLFFYHCLFSFIFFLYSIYFDITASLYIFSFFFFTISISPSLPYTFSFHSSVFFYFLSFPP